MNIALVGMAGGSGKVVCILANEYHTLAAEQMVHSNIHMFLLHAFLGTGSSLSTAVVAALQYGG